MLRETDDAIALVAPSPPVAIFQYVVMAEDAAFESLHPRGTGGRFSTKARQQEVPSGTRKPYEGEKPGSELVNGFGDRVANLLRRLGYDVRPVKLSVIPDSSMPGVTEGRQFAQGEVPLAFALPGEVVITESVAKMVESAQATMDKWGTQGYYGRPTEEDKRAMRVVVHEMLHQVSGMREWEAATASGDWARMTDGISTEEGTVEANTLDVLNTWGKKWYATFPFYPPGYLVFQDPKGPASYKDMTVEIRKVSARATGTKWSSPRAAKWRVALLNADFQKRKAMIDAAMLKPLPAKNALGAKPKKRSLSEDGAVVMLPRAARLTEHGEKLLLGSVTFPDLPRKVTRGMLSTIMRDASDATLAYLLAEMSDSSSTLRLEMVRDEIRRREVLRTFFGDDHDERVAVLAESWQEHLHPRGHGGKFTRKFNIDLPDGGTQEIEAHFREASPNDRNALKIPPAWTDVYVTDHPQSPLRAVGKDTKGRTQRRYSVKFLEANQAAKFERLRQFDSSRADVLKATEEDDSDNAMVVRLIALTGIRPGSEKDTGGAKKAYGATTLQAEHVRVEGDKVFMDFVGKEGIDNHFEVTDRRFAKWLDVRLEKTGNGEQIFHGATDATARRWMAEHGGKGFLLKDFRTWIATATALRMVKESSPPPPVDAKDFAKRRKDIGTVVSQLLNNTPQMALSNYISPAVFDQWRVEDVAA